MKFKYKGMLLLLAVLLVLSVAGCGNSSSSDNKENQQIEVEQQETAADTQNTGVAQQNTESAVQNVEAAPPQTAPETQAPAENAIPETLLLDQNGVRISARGMDQDAFLGPELKLIIENNSGQNLTVQCRDVSVNGFMVSPVFSTDVVNGKSATDSLTILSSELKDAGIETISNIELSFDIFNSETWEEYMTTAPISLNIS